MLISGAYKTITLAGSDIDISEALTINANALVTGVTIDANQRSRIFDITANVGDFTLAGLTLTGGDSSLGGGAIRSDTTGVLRIDQSLVSDNESFERGGGISAVGDVILTQTTVSGNQTFAFQARGGGISTFGNITMIGSAVTFNSTSGDVSRGGGLSASGDVTITDSTISGNSTSGEFALGGGIDALFSVVTVTRSVVTGNSVTGETSGGGGIAADNVMLYENTVSENFTLRNESEGGGIFANNVTLTQSTVSGNSTAGINADGAGVNSNGTVSVVRSTVTDNHANHISSYGGSFWSQSSSTLSDSILSGNSDGAGNPDLYVRSSINVEFSLVGNTSGLTPGQIGAINNGSGNIINVDPLLGPLADNGGPTQTHLLLSGSPAIDMGKPFSSHPQYDQRGKPFKRVLEGEVDMGAVEAELAFIVDTLVDEDDGDFSAGDLSLREAIGLANDNFLRPGIDTIRFSSSLAPGVLLLTMGNLDVFEGLRIFGPDQQQIINGNGFDIFVLNASSPEYDFFDFSTLVLTGGASAIVTRDDVNISITDSLISGNGVFGSSASAINASNFNNNLMLLNSTVSNNLKGGVSGGVVIVEGSLIANNLGTGIRANTVTLTDSTVSGNSSSTEGGGIRANSVTLMTSAISDNSTTGNGSRGGGIYSSSNVDLTQSIVSGNGTIGSSSHGGGIYSRNGFVTLTNSTVSGNSTEGIFAAGGGVAADNVMLIESTVSGNSSFGGGGGIAAILSVTLTDSSVIDNYTTGLDADGGGVTTVNGAVILTDSVVSYNRTEGDLASGGGIRARNGQVVLTRSTVSGNSTLGDGASGGGIYGSNGVTLNQSTVSGNRTDGSEASGGGIFGGSRVTLIQSTISGNSTAGADANGGGINTVNNYVSLYQSTVTNNSASHSSSYGGGIWSSNGPITLGSSIIANNTSGAGNPDLGSNTGSITGSYNVIGDTADLTAQQLIEINSGIVNLLNVDPLIGPLSDNGGLTQTHALLPGSPALNTGDDSVTETNDQRGPPFLRNDGNGVDIGTYEAQATPSADFVGDDFVNGADFLAWQRGFGTSTGATRADGNSDDDGDVDASDLAAWLATYGQVDTTPLAAAGRGAPGSPVGSAALINAALALELLSVEDDDLATPLVAAEPQAVVERSVAAPELVTPIDSADNSPIVESGEETEADNQTWLAEELLERVFG